MQTELPFAERRLVKSSMDNPSVITHDKSPTYVSRIGTGEGTADDVEAIAASSGFQFSFPFGFGPCPSIPPPLAKQWGASCDFLPQLVHKTPFGFFSCL